jgi:hypothetical protein
MASNMTLVYQPAKVIARMLEHLPCRRTPRPGSPGGESSGAGGRHHGIPGSGQRRSPLAVKTTYRLGTHPCDSPPPPREAVAHVNTEGP